MYLQRIALFFFFVFICWGLLPAKTERLRCTWRENPATSMVIGWDQVTGSDPVLYYDISDKGAATGSYSWSARPVRVVVAKGMNNQFVRLQHLQPNTVYYGIIKDSEGFSQKFSFKTAPGSADQRLSIVAGGDSRNYREARQDANRLVGKLRPHVVLFGGDMTAGDTDTEWIEWMDDWQLTIAADGRMTPVLPARGNHEATNQVLVDLFDVKNADAYYALSFGGDLLRVYTLNSMIPAGGAQRDWLERDLKANPGVQWRMAQYHLPMRPHHASKRENEDERKNWAPLFFQHRMNVAIECDAHVVKLTHPIRIDDGPGSEEGFIRDDDYGTVYAGEGCWGAPLRANDDDKSWTRASGSFNQFKWIFVGREGIEMRTIKTDGSDRVASVDPADIFEPPVGLAIWNPPGGDVVYIRPARTLAAPGYQLPADNMTAAAGDNGHAVADELPAPGPAESEVAEAAVFPELRPEGASGQVQIKYQLDKPADVVIRLFSPDRQCLDTRQFKGQTQGQYAPAIDLKALPKGRYLVIVKANQQVICRYWAVKG